MTIIDAILTLNGQAGIPVRLVETGSANAMQYDLLDANGHVLALPSGVSLDSSTMTIKQNGVAVGSITPTPLNDTPTTTDTSSSTSVGGAGTGVGTTTSSTPPSVDTTASTASTDTPTADPSAVVEQTVTGKRVTKTLPDGMWRPAVATTGTGGTGGGDGSGGGEGGSGLGTDGSGSGGDPAENMFPGDPSVDNFGAGGTTANGTGGGEGTPTDTGFGTVDYEGSLGPANIGTGSSSQQPPSSGMGASGAISTIGTALGGLAAVGQMLKWGKEGSSLAKGLGILGVIGGGIGSFFAFKSLGEKFSAMAVVNASVAVATFIYSFMHTFKFAHAGPWGALIIAAIAATAFTIGKTGKKTNNEVDTSKGDVGQYPTWANYMPTVNQFTILAGISSLAIGINLAGSGPSFQSVVINASKTSDVNAQLAAATGNAFQGNSAQAALGKVFIKPMGDSSKVVFVEKDPQKSDSYRVNMVTLNDGGYVTGQAKAVKELQMTPFFFVEKKTGAITPNQEAVRQLNLQNAMASTANSNQISGVSAARAAQIGAMQGHQGVDYYSK